MKIRVKGDSLAFRCPGCKCVHRFNTTWVLSGTEEEPTVSPSILVNGIPESVGMRCHSFVTKGQIQFLEDCGHDLRGKTVPLPEWQPDEYELGDIQAESKGAP